MLTKTLQIGNTGRYRYLPTYLPVLRFNIVLMPIWTFYFDADPDPDSDTNPYLVSCQIPIQENLRFKKKDRHITFP